MENIQTNSATEQPAPGRCTFWRVMGDTLGLGLLLTALMAIFSLLLQGMSLFADPDRRDSVARNPEL